MNFLVVDDDDIICRGVTKRLLSFAHPQIAEVRHAYSAEDALALLQTYPCDIMITDIHMQEMDGLQLIESAQRLHTEMRFIILTAYDEFRYAQNALRLGVSDFLVKPCSEQQMYEVVSKVIDDLRAARDMRIHRLSWGVEEWMESSASLGALEDLMAQADLRLPGSMRVIAWSEPQATPPHIRPQVWRFAPLGKRYLFVGDVANDEILMENSLLGFSLGVSDPGKPEALRQLLLQARTALSDAWYYREPALIGRDCTLPDERAVIGAAEHAWSLLLSRPQTADAQNWLHAHCEGVAEKPGRAAHTRLLLARLYRKLDQLCMGWQLEDAYAAQPVERCRGWQEAIAQLVQSYAAAVEKRATMQAADPIAWAKHYMLTHLDTECDMAVIANSLDISYSYFSKLFKERTGVTFSEYNMQVRMQEAEKLLRAGQRVTRVAQLLGYQNIQNFSRAFQRYFGRRPTAVRARQGSAGGKGQ